MLRGVLVGRCGMIHRVLSVVGIEDLSSEGKQQHRSLGGIFRRCCLPGLVQFLTGSLECKIMTYLQMGGLWHKTLARNISEHETNPIT